VFRNGYIEGPVTHISWATWAWKKERTGIQVRMEVRVRRAGRRGRKERGERRRWRRVDMIRGCEGVV